MTQYRPFEMHCHTRHSDGTFLVPQLLESAAAYGYAGLALTDHNAVTGLLEVTPELEARTCRVIPGIEWTTFYGHLLVLGCRHFVDWRFVTPDTIDQALEEIRAAGGVAGVAHPCEVGAPLMCGCNWEFRVRRWDLVDYVEIWSGDDPHARAKNALALPWYDALLNQGHHLAISAGRDWHGPDVLGSTPLLTATYLGVDGALTAENALAAIQGGRTYVTLGPTLEIALSQQGSCLGLGETARPGRATVRVAVGETDRREIWKRNEIHPRFVRLVANGSTLAELPCGEAAVEFSVELTPGWLRVELHGSDFHGIIKTIALTSPIYVEAGDGR
ncbi:CehA/McbA family metallohydrolase [Dysosmobacter sp.]